MSNKSLLIILNSFLRDNINIKQITSSLSFYQYLQLAFKNVYEYVHNNLIEIQNKNFCSKFTNFVSTNGA